MTRPRRTEQTNARFVPGQPDMWAFVLFETLVFTSVFRLLPVLPGPNPELFLHSQAHLDLRVGVFNTLVLLLSSWSVARCVQSARAGAYRAALRDVFITAAFAAVFLFFKVFEWVRLVHSRKRGGQQRLLHVLLLPHRDPLRSPADRLRRPRHHRLPTPESGAAGSQELVETVRNVLAHSRLPVGAHLRAALRGEVTE